MADKLTTALGFEMVSREEYLQNAETQLAVFVVARSTSKAPEKRGPGRPRSVIHVADMLVREPIEVQLLSSSDDEELVLKKRPRTGITRPRKYSNWFTGDHWPHIDAALRLCRWKPRDVVRYLQLKHGGPNGKFSALNESTVRGWLGGPEKNQYTVKVERAIAAIELQGWRGASKVMHPGAVGVWASIPELELQFKESLIALRDAQVALNSLFIQLRMKAFLKVHAPMVLKDSGGGFSICRSFVRRWVRHKLHWTFRRQTSDCSKLPKQWEELGHNLKLRIAYLVMAHDIPMELVVNADQTGLQLLPVGNEKTYALKGAKSILVSGGGDKRQISLMLACTAAGNLLPSQLIFEGKTKAVVPDGQHATLLRHMGWNLTHSPNHWSSVLTMKDWVNKIYIPWVQATATVKGLDPKTTKSILLLDCFSVHRSEEFRTWLKSTHPNVYLLFVPANCTSKLQPCDVILQRPYKCAVQHQFGEYSVEEMARKLQAGEKPADIRLETSIVVLRRLLCEYLWKAHQDLARREQMIQVGWKKIGLLDAWLRVTQSEAAESAAAGNLFDMSNVLEIKEEHAAEGDDNWLGDVTVDDVFKAAVEDTQLPPELEYDLEDKAASSSIPNPTLVNFVGGSGGKRVCFTQYLSNPGTVTPYH